MNDSSSVLDELVAAEMAGSLGEFLFFWGHQPSRAGCIDSACLSQWWPKSFVVEGIQYPTAEHWLMASKARFFDDSRAEQLILCSEQPADAKALGRRVRNFDEGKWAEVRAGIAVEGNLAKFSQNRDLGDFLLSTGDMVLVESSPSDNIWGIGIARDDPSARRPSQWQGLNLLGFVLMHVRELLRS